MNEFSLFGLYTFVNFKYTIKLCNVKYNVENNVKIMFDRFIYLFLYINIGGNTSLH